MLAIIEHSISSGKLSLSLMVLRDSLLLSILLPSRKPSDWLRSPSHQVTVCEYEDIYKHKFQAPNSIPNPKSRAAMNQDFTEHYTAVNIENQTRVSHAK
jgi:hypothetical protein